MGLMSVACLREKKRPEKGYQMPCADSFQVLCMSDIHVPYSAERLLCHKSLILFRWGRYVECVHLARGFVGYSAPAVEATEPPALAW